MSFLRVGTDRLRIAQQGVKSTQPRESRRDRKDRERAHVARARRAALTAVCMCALGVVSMLAVGFGYGYPGTAILSVDSHPPTPFGEWAIPAVATILGFVVLTLAGICARLAAANCGNLSDLKTGYTWAIIITAIVTGPPVLGAFLLLELVVLGPILAVMVGCIVWATTFPALAVRIRHWLAARNKARQIEVSAVQLAASATQLTAAVTRTEVASESSPAGSQQQDN